MNVYPNPNNGSFIIESIISDPNKVLVIDNIMGQNVLKQELKVSRNAINLTTQPNGMYIYKVVSANNDLIEYGKIIIEK